MEQLGEGNMNTNVDMEGSIVNEFKDGGNSATDIHTDIVLMHEQGGDSDVLFAAILCALASGIMHPLCN